MVVLQESTCGAENALSPALIAKPLKLLYNTLHHWHGTNLAIQKTFHLYAPADLARLCCWLSS